MCCLVINSFTRTKVPLLCHCDYMEETLQRVCRHLDNMLLLGRHRVSKFSAQFNESLLEFHLGLFSKSDFNYTDVNLNVVMKNQFADVHPPIHSK